MALDMQRRLSDLGERWHRKGIEHPFKARMGINTGFCNVGNFGSDERMDYTIIGAEANLAARLESIAEPGGIVLSYETYAHVRDIVEASAMEPVYFKGIAREVVPYNISSLEKPAASVFSRVDDTGHMTLDLNALSEDARARVEAAVREALGMGHSKT